ncbi:MAG: DUF2330 domain-containing protein [Verrucomicrobiota bacterium]
MKRIFKTLILIFAFPLVGNTDMGSIPFKKGTRIFEPAQDAIIAWNGQEQLLYLQTTLAASEQTKVLEVMPLPNKPAVEASNPGVFKRCAFLLPPIPAKSDGSDPFGPTPETSAARVIERKLIEAHDLRVVELLDAKRFSEWVFAEFGDENDELEIPEALLKVIQDYANDGFKWFLFDLIDVKKEKAQKTPLQIQFVSDHLYYPLRITSTEKGKTEISLSVITNVLFEKEDCVGIARESIEVPSNPITISAEQIHFIDPPIFELLGKPREASLRLWRISGQIDAFEKDLLIQNPAFRKTKR